MTTLKRLREEVQWKRVDSPFNKYKANPDHNSRDDMKGDKLPLPSAQTYKEILAKQKEESDFRKKDFEEKMAAAIKQDAKK